MPLGSRIARGVILNVGIRWTDRLIGFASTLILARLLVPQDFGIIAQASIVIGMIDIFLDLGVAMALIQNRHAEREHYDTAWTMRLAQCSLAALVVIGAAPLAGSYFAEPRVVPVLTVLALGLVLSGCENIGVVAFQKEMRFGLDFRFRFIKRIAAFVTTIVLATIWVNYWALVAGVLTSRVVGVWLSYRMHPMRPRLCVSKFREIFSFSQWALVRGVGQYFNNELHRLFVGGRASTAVMGAYTVANEISAMPATEMLAPINRALFPAFVQAKENLCELKRLFLLTQGLQSLVVIPASVGLALVAPEVVYVLLGEKWEAAIPFLRVLALAYVVNAITTSAGYVIITMGRIGWSAVVYWSQVVIFAVSALVLLPEASAYELAWLRLGAVVCGLFVELAFLCAVLPEVRIADMAGTVYRPVAAALAMSAAVLQLDSILSWPALPALLAKVALGGLVYVASIALLWYCSGRPQGAERYLENAFVGLRKRYTS